MKVGIDLAEHKDFINKEALINRILSPLEKAKYNTITSEKRKLEYVASRFAAKEAIFKVYEEGDKTLNFKDISILNKENGAPYISSDFLKDKLEISISHSENYSIAIVILP